jgi:hypothetical protein
MTIPPAPAKAPMTVPPSPAKAPPTIPPAPAKAPPTIPPAPARAQVVPSVASGAAAASSGMLASGAGKALSGLARAIPYVGTSLVVEETIRDIINQTEASNNARANAYAQTARSAEKVVSGYEAQIDKLGSVEEQQNVVKSLDEAIASAREEASAAGVDEQIAAALRQEAKALEIVKQKVQAVTAAELNRREQAAIAKANTESNQLTLDTRDAERKANAVKESMQALQGEIAKIDASTQREQAKAQLANPEDKRAGVAAQQSGLNQQKSVVSDALTKARQELASIVPDKTQAPALFEADLREADRSTDGDGGLFNPVRNFLNNN